MSCRTIFSSRTNVYLCFLSSNGIKACCGVTDETELLGDATKTMHAALKENSAHVPMTPRSSV
jgi:hypothetical protein